jgi:hypothetical protein
MIIRSAKPSSTIFTSLRVHQKCLRTLHSSTPSKATTLSALEQAQYENPRSLLFPNTPKQPPKIIPEPTPFVPDVPTFLTLIGRGLSKHTSKFPSWSFLFSLTPPKLRKLGVEPARPRRYLLWWVDRFRRGEFGIGGDLKVVENGEGLLKVEETVENGRIIRRVVNGGAVVKGVKAEGPRTVAGSWVEMLKSTDGVVARLKVKEGMWENRQGHKVHGGERRRKNVLSRIAARARGTLK